MTVNRRRIFQLVVASPLAAILPPEPPAPPLVFGSIIWIVTLDGEIDVKGYPMPELPAAPKTFSEWVRVYGHDQNGNEMETTV